MPKPGFKSVTLPNNVLKIMEEIRDLFEQQMGVRLNQKQTVEMSLRKYLEQLQAET